MMDARGILRGDLERREHEAGLGWWLTQVLRRMGKVALLLLRRVHAWRVWPWRLLWKALVGRKLWRAILRYSVGSMRLDWLRLVWRRWSMAVLWTRLEWCLSRRIGR
jgi:hypothetical protein